MSLTTGHGPLSPEPAGRFIPDVPPGAVYVEPHLRRIRALIGGRTVIDTERAQLVHRPGLPTSYAFPIDDVPVELADPEPAVPGHVAVPWDRVDAWYEEDVHLADQRYPKNPYHRVDCMPDVAPSRRRGRRRWSSSTRRTRSSCSRRHSPRGCTSPRPTCGWIC